MVPSDAQSPKTARGTPHERGVTPPQRCPHSLGTEPVVLLLLQQAQLRPGGGLRERGERVGREHGGPSVEGASAKGPTMRPARLDPTRPGTLTWARSRCGRCRALAAFLKAAHMAAMAAPSAGTGSERPHAGRAPERAGPAGVRSPGPRAPPPGGAVSMATAGTRGRPRARPRPTAQRPPAWVGLAGTAPRGGGSLRRRSLRRGSEPSERSGGAAPEPRDGAHPAAGRTGAPRAGSARSPRWRRRRSASRRPSAVLGGHRPWAAPGPAPGRAPRSRLGSSAKLSRVCRADPGLHVAGAPRAAAWPRDAD